MTYMIIVKVAGRDYLTNVEADSASAAEHMILDHAICGKHEYGVDAAQAFDAKMMKTDCFIGCAMSAEPIGYLALCDIIDRNNARIQKNDAAEELILKNEKILAEMKVKMAEIENEIAQAKKKIA